MTTGPGATELHKMGFCEGDNLRAVLDTHTHTQEDYLVDLVHIWTKSGRSNIKHVSC